MANKIIIDGQTVMQVAESYSELIEKPSINSVELVGNKTSSELGMYTSEEVDHLLAQSRSVKISPTDPPEDPEAGVLYYCDKQDPEDPTNYHVWLCDSDYNLIDLGDSKMDLAEKQDKEPKYQDEAGNVWYEIGHNPALIDDKLLTSHKVADAINEIDTILQEKQDKLDENLKTEDKSVVGAINELIIQVKELPTPSIDYLGKIYEYIGETDENYIRGRFYDCVKKEDEETGAISYVWEEVVGSGGGGAAQWESTKTYAKDEQVWVYDEENRMYRYFFSLADDNLGNDPISTEGKKWLSAGTTSISGVIGEVINFAGTTPPANFLVCAGQAVSRTTYKDLFNVIGTTYGDGDGSTTFNLPLLTDSRFVEGSSTPGTKKDGAIPSHKHTYDKAISGDWAKSASGPYGDATFGDYGIPYLRDMQSVNHNDNQYDDLRMYKGNDYATSGDIDWIAVSPKDSRGAGVKPIKILTESANTLTYGSGTVVQPKSLTLLPCIRYAKDRERYGDHLFKVYSSSQAPNPADYKEGDIVLWIQG